MAHGAHGALGWESSDNQLNMEHEGPGGALGCGDRGADRKLGPDLRALWLEQQALHAAEGTTQIGGAAASCRLRAAQEEDFHVG